MVSIFTTLSILYFSCAWQTFWLALCYQPWLFWKRPIQEGRSQLPSSVPYVLGSGENPCSLRPMVGGGT